MEKLIDLYIVAREKEKQIKELEKENKEKHKRNYAMCLARTYYENIKKDIQNGIDYWENEKEDYCIGDINQDSSDYFAEYLQELTGFPCYAVTNIVHGRKKVFIRYPLMK